MKKLIVLLVLLAIQPIAAKMGDWLPVEIVRGHVIIDIEIGGVPAKAMLDTGAQINVVSKEFLAKHEVAYTKGEQAIIRGVYGEERINLVDNLELTLYGSKIKQNGLYTFGGSDRFDLIFGMPFFHAFVVQIDYPSSKYRLLPHNSINLKKVANLKFTRKSNSQLITPVIFPENKKVNLLLDTGNSGGILMDRVVVDSENWIEKYRKGEAKGKGVTDKIVTSDLLVMPEVKFGPFTLEDVVLTTPEEGNSRFIGQKKFGAHNRDKATYRGILGYDMLKHFLVTIDAKNSRGHLQPL